MTDDKVVRFPVIDGGGKDCDEGSGEHPCGILIGNRLWRSILPEGWPDVRGR